MTTSIKCRNTPRKQKNSGKLEESWLFLVPNWLFLENCLALEFYPPDFECTPLNEVLNKVIGNLTRRLYLCSMTTGTKFKIECRAKTPEDKVFLALCCSHKNLAVNVVKTEETSPSIKWPGSQVVGAAAICLLLEAAVPEPSLFPNGNIGMPVALLHWLQSMKKATAQNEETLKANAFLIARQLEDGRPFLQGSSPGLADICAASWLLPHQTMSTRNQTLVSWARRMNRTLTPAKDVMLRKLFISETMLSGKQYQGLINSTTRGDFTIFTSPLDSIKVPEKPSS